VSVATARLALVSLAAIAASSLAAVAQTPKAAPTLTPQAATKAPPLFPRCEVFAIGGMQPVPRREEACAFQKREVAILVGRLKAIGMEEQRLRRPPCVPMPDVSGSVRVPTGVKVEVRSADDYQRLVTAFGAPGSGVACECTKAACPK
jgi:hypothetical protein